MLEFAKTVGISTGRSVGLSVCVQHECKFVVGLEIRRFAESFCTA